MPAAGFHKIYSPQVKSLQVVVNQNWQSLPVMKLNSADRLYVGFDELSHDYHRYICHIERCEADWTTATEMFESDWLNGFNDLIVDDYEHSINTTVPYTHYQFSLPNDQCHLKMSGNYRLHIQEDGTDEDVLTVEFMVTEQSMQISMTATTNTDQDTNGRHQQVSMSIGYMNHSVVRPDEQIQTVVMQNGREDNCRRNVRPAFVNQNGQEWSHAMEYIFDAGNEYRKYEVLDPTHPTMGIDYIRWDGDHYQVFPYISEPRPNYLYDEDADGAFYIRNSDNRENDIISDYVWINYRLKSDPVSDGYIVIDGQWTTENSETYRMTYDENAGMYTASILQKQGYYSYQYLWEDNRGTRRPLPSEGNFYPTENRYQAFIYFKEVGGRTWRLTAFGQITLN
ncbi:MAG: DUF5103 domain-containing protein [Prevotella sp.]|nr:DUF5103 domain-containing protein [Prevotella sp.]